MSEHDQLAALLDSFSAAFADQDAGALRDLFAEGDASLVTSEELVLHHRMELDRFFDAYARQPVSIGFEWDVRHVDVVEDVGWVLALGREIARHGPQEQRWPFRLTLVTVRSPEGWRIAHAHASSPAA
ncbi:nuclear transport factor 2 family protein [Nocardioides sp. GCM10027113]|uniref:nuclear transport factor 2 family protein n=1 Tax=unclassified Nocardioides TaxID=2615069 RepID=UPI00360C7F8F